MRSPPARGGRAHARHGLSPERSDYKPQDAPHTATLQSPFSNRPIAARAAPAAPRLNLGQKLAGWAAVTARGEGPVWARAGGGGSLALSVRTAVRTWPLGSKPKPAQSGPRAGNSVVPVRGVRAWLGPAPPRELQAWRRAASVGASRRVSRCISGGLWPPFSLTWPKPPAPCVPVRAAAGVVTGGGGTGAWALRPAHSGPLLPPCSDFLIAPAWKEETAATAARQEKQRRMSPRRRVRPCH